MREIDEKFAKATQKGVTEELRTGLWRAYARYEIYENKRGERGGMDFYTKRAHIKLGEPGSRMWQYAPLVETLDLFVRFARLADREITRSTWEEWIATYGVLGLQGGVNAAKGGPEETFSRFAEEAQFANETLKLYEAASGPGGPDLDYIREYARRRVMVPQRGDGSLATNAGELREWALFVVGRRAQRKLRSECHPQLYQNRDGTFALSWDFQSVLGAMYLQLAFLMTAATAARFCKAPNCHKVIALDAPEETPEGKLERLSKGASKPYKTRSDKEFCDKACYMKWKRRNEKTCSTNTARPGVSL